MAGCVLVVRAVPNASRTEVAGVLGDAVKIRLRAVPEDGRANRELLEFLSGKLGLPIRALTLIAGETGRDKRVGIDGADATAVRAALGLPSG